MSHSETSRQKSVQSHAGHSSASPGEASEGSRVVRFQPDFRWEQVTPRRYKDGEGPWKGVVRHVLAGGPDHELPFELRYFEVAPGGYTTLEQHTHEHVVLVLRGGGSVRLGDRTEQIGYGDMVYVSPWEVHQFTVPEGREPLGFLCIVAKDRDRPVPVQEQTSQSRSDPS